MTSIELKAKRYTELGIISLILSLAALLLFYLFPVISFALEITAIGIGAAGLRQVRKGFRTGSAIAISGLALGIIAIIITVSASLFSLIGIKLFASILYFYVTFTELL